MSETFIDSDALYYPYIHIQDEAWLKTTMLFFPHVLRMVPPKFSTQDSLFVQSLTEQLGRQDRPLLASYPLQGIYTYTAIKKLLDRLLADQEADAEFAARFSRAAAVSAYGSDNRCLIHRGKAPSSFWDELHRLGLIWTPSNLSEARNAAWTAEADTYDGQLHPPTQQPGEWAAIHPVLGEVFMATVAAAVAQDRGLQIVTDAPHIHGVAACRDEDLVYARLVHWKRKPDAGRLRQTMTRVLQSFGLPGPAKPVPGALRLEHLVIAGNFDLSGVGAKELAALSKEKCAISDFRELIANKLTNIPEVENSELKQKYLQETADEVIAEWKSTVPNLSNTWKRLLNGGWSEKAEKSASEFAKELLKPSTSVPGVGTGVGAIAAGAPALLAVGAGLAIGMASYAFSTWRGLKYAHKQGPLRYLTLLQKQGATLMMAPPPEPAS